MKIYCCTCHEEIDATLTDGKEIYPHRSDLSSLPFWKCGTCKNYVGCHYKTKNRTRPLGCIPNREIRNARMEIHKKLDPIWKSGTIKRGDLYRKISGILGYEYHSAEIKSIEQARDVYRAVLRCLG